MKTRNGYKTYPLTAPQKFHFFYMEHCPKKEVVNVGTSLTIEYELDIDVLRKAIYKAYERCEAMRLRFAYDKKEKQWYQYIVPREEKTVDEELWVRGSSVMQGYYHMPEETAATLEEGWLKTGDLGYVDEDGFVFWTGRKKNLIIITPNGENISPEEIENKLGENRLVQEVLVRDSEGVIEAEIFPDYAYAAKKKFKDMQKELQEIIDVYNKTVPLYKRIFKLKIREVEFEKNTMKKIKRF